MRTGFGKREAEFGASAAGLDLRALNDCGLCTAVIGTLGYGMRGRLKPLANTTPDAVWLQAQLADFARRGARVALRGWGE